jgi:DNA-directed RNA polymerase subunit RPC12/RpoP
MMQVQITCPHCGSGITVLPAQNANAAKCDVCSHVVPVTFNEIHEKSELVDCPVCSRMDFYQQKDFNRKIGAALFVIAACLVPWTYGLSLLVLYLMDVFLFRRLSMIAICYKCKTIFRNVANIQAIRPYDHEMNDRIVYSDHDFKGKPLSH